MALDNQKPQTAKESDGSKEGAWVWNATRAPNSSDKNFRAWVFRDGTTLKLYLYDSIAGAWRGPQAFT